MSTLFNRRSVLAGLSAAIALGMPALAKPPGFVARIEELEAKSGGLLGVCVIDPASGQMLSHRGDERFPLCSTYKLMAAAYLLKRVDAGEERLDRRIKYGADQLVGASKYTSRYAGGSGVPLSQLAKAAIIYSDSTAGNLLVQTFGGPEALTEFMRGIGDAVTRVDRYEPALAEAVPGDPRDTTSPQSMARNLQLIIAGDVLSEAGRAQIVEWMMANETGNERLRAGVPPDWRVGDKTGASRNGVTNDIGFLQRPGGSRLFVTAYLAEPQVRSIARNAIIADVARAVVASF